MPNCRSTKVDLLLSGGSHHKLDFPCTSAAALKYLLFVGVHWPVVRPARACGAESLSLIDMPSPLSATQLVRRVSRRVPASVVASCSHWQRCGFDVRHSGLPDKHR